MYKPNDGINKKVHERVNQIKILQNNLQFKQFFTIINLTFLFLKC